MNEKDKEALRSIGASEDFIQEAEQFIDKQAIKSPTTVKDDILELLQLIKLVFEGMDRLNEK